MADAAFLSTFEQYSQQSVARIRKLPLSFWRALVIALALLWIVSSIAKLIWVLMPAPTLPQPAKVAVVPDAETSTSSGGHSVDLAALQAAQIFGEGVEGELVVDAQALQQQQAAVREDVEKTQLKLKLTGLVATGDKATSSAVIASGSSQKVYQIDDKLPEGNNVTLAKVLHDRVILNNNGNYEALWLYTEADFKVNYANSNRGASRPSEDAPMREPRVMNAKLSKSQMPKSISEVVRFSVHREEGQMVGFRIRPGKNRDLFEQLGLQANDIVTSVNGIPIDSPQAIRDHYQQLKSSTAADLEIRRGEETLYISVSVDTEVSE